KLLMTGTDSTAVSLGLPMNNTADNLDFFVARDEAFMILAKNGLQISFHKNNGGWTNPKSLGSTINFGLGMWGPYVTSDNKYLFYTTGTNPNYSDTRIHWVRIDGLMDSLKHTNFVPYLKNQIPNRTDTVGNLFNFTVPDSTFIDDDGNNTLTYSATLSNGNPLPSWLSFNPGTRTFSGIPTALGSIGLKVIVTDTANATATCTFTLNVIDHTSINQHNEQIINEYKLFQNYPNPFNPITKIKFEVPLSKGGLMGVVSMRVYDILGKEIATLVNEKLQPGTYEVSFDGSNLNSGVYFCTLTVNETNTNTVFKETKLMNLIK
ncbi:MAG TPA: putative Ig domain-containing protein, partial [Ignavibacteria bacterium]